MLQYHTTVGTERAGYVLYRALVDKIKGLSRIYWIFGENSPIWEIYSCAVGGDPAMNIIIARVPVLDVPE